MPDFGDELQLVEFTGQMPRLRVIVSRNLSERSGDPVISGDIQEYPNSEIQKYPIFRNQYRGSTNTGNGLSRNGFD